ncbi:MAG: tRNA uridine-5-carboxymethylaminomethyl(34) synthesis GTPase MnmE [Desulfurispora sp.]|uniref:tRNA uridine-5-carboxymethylaminomethyl(34) synthesis GTPase MnmE n=1 Tax=Desulfurispora sp. TaxID=3014275 RepID=UPI00404B6AE9
MNRFILDSDTIAAIATAPGEGAIGIVRLSGPQAVEIARRLFRPGKEMAWSPQSHRLYYGHIVDPADGRVVDEVLVAVMLAPRTYTREDVVEINCHGGITPLRQVLQLVLAAGARLAGPGEFTKRAFLNGRIDLAQAEAVIDIIRARTGAALRLAVQQLGGGLSRRIEGMQQNLLGLLAAVEAVIDFPEDDLPALELDHLARQAEELAGEIDQLIRSAFAGRVYREGLRTVLAGRPNVGKSSLLNALLKESRAIVTDIPGTTRDIIEEYINIEGVPLRLLDTAGLRETADPVEKIGVERTKEALEQADLVLLLVEAGRALEPAEKELLAELDPQRTILVVNKVDLVEEADGQAAVFSGGRREEAAGRAPLRLVADTADQWPGRVVYISALHEQGLEELKKAIVELVHAGELAAPGEAVLVNLRHEEALKRAYQHLMEVPAAVSRGVPLELLSIDLRQAWEALGEITGTAVAGDIVERIFSDFCIGK